MGWTIAATLIGGAMASKSASRDRRAAQQRSDEALAFQKEQHALLEKQKEIYRSLEFKNPYADMENVYEDLTVNQQQARFQAQQGAQQRADILSGLRGGAGGAGIATLAQALANQGALQSQQISANIGQQEAQNRMLAAQGASATEMAERGGEAMIQQAEMDRQSTLLGVAYSGAAGANAGVQQAYSNAMQADAYASRTTNTAWTNALKTIATELDE